MSTRPTFMSLGGILQLFRMWEHIQLQPSSCTEIYSGLLKVCLQCLSRICFSEIYYSWAFKKKKLKPFIMYTISLNLLYCTLVRFVSNIIDNGLETDVVAD